MAKNKATASHPFDSPWINNNNNLGTNETEPFYFLRSKSRKLRTHFCATNVHMNFGHRVKITHTIHGRHNLCRTIEFSFIPKPPCEIFIRHAWKFTQLWPNHLFFNRVRCSVAVWSYTHTTDYTIVVSVSVSDLFFFHSSAAPSEWISPFIQMTTSQSAKLGLNLSTRSRHVRELSEVQSNNNP